MSVDQIARALLYEGYVLYPYRSSSLKNTRPWTFGILYPPDWVATEGGADRSFFRAECIVAGGGAAAISASVRFLQLGHTADAVEREVCLDVSIEDITASPRCRKFTFDQTIEGEVTLAAEGLRPGVFKLTAEVRNTSQVDGSPGEPPLTHSLASAHAAFQVTGGAFVSITDPPPEFAEATALCSNEGVWPVLVGETGAHDTMLASPIILPDYPQVAPESAGDLCDATEIDEILTLRILTLTDEEKAEVRASGERARNILESVETFPAEHLMRLHGAIRDLAPVSAPLDHVVVRGCRFQAGDRVRLRPGKRADIFDSALDGRVAVIAGIEQDFEDNVHVAVVVEDDPGRDLGEMRQIGHRFFFAPSEIEALETRP